VNASGNEAEERAAAFLSSRGLRVLERNWRCRFGEIDLVARDGSTVVFVEVRSRATASFGGAAGSIGRGKRRKLIAAANLYLAARRIDAPCRFDAVLLEGGSMRWLRDAFRVGE
jgi:putative endonuclease